MFDSEFIHDNISDTRMVLGVGGVSRWMTAARALSPCWKPSWRGGGCGSGSTCWGGGRPGGSATPRLVAMLCRMAQAQTILQTFCGLYRSRPPDASRQRQRPFRSPIAQRARTWASLYRVSWPPCGSGTGTSNHSLRK